MLVIIRQQSERLFVSGLYLTPASLSTLTSCAMSLTRIKKCGLQTQKVSRVSTKEASFQQPMPANVLTKEQTNAIESI